MALSCIISETERDIGRKSRFFYTHLHRRPRPNTAITFGMGKPEWWLYKLVKKFDDTFSRFGTILACDGRTDRRTDRHTATTYAHASSGNNYM